MIHSMCSAMSALYLSACSVLPYSSLPRFTVCC
jgi:hypothetical protein